MAGKKKFKITLDAIVSWGATVVIIGALFKIMHWPGGGIVISVGLLVEALLFFIMGFKPPHPEPEWEKVYPQLAEDYKGELPDMNKAVKLNELEIKGNVSGGGGLPDLQVSDEFIAKVRQGLDNFSNKIASISSAADASVATAEFANKISAAADKAENLGQAFEKASAGVIEVAQASTASKAYHEQISNLGKNISALNAVYELELKDSSEHLKTMGKFYQNLSQTMENFNESLEDSKQFKEEVGKLSKNLSSLNAVYGNMLSAMNQPRA
ncbi:gliding motility protein GldL [Pseudopedobacter beijingensis]|uniref:Gliding motility protein GldL n=1 Tax=Pseudopedobacter beijingensis TaxID=1207056 RepID=A0ABW4IC16_9SPHI